VADAVVGRTGAGNAWFYRSVECKGGGRRCGCRVLCL